MSEWCRDVTECTEKWIFDLDLSGIEDLLMAGLQSAAGQVDHLLRGLPGDDCLDHGAGRLPMQIADHHAKANPTVAQHLVQPVLLRGPLANQLLSLTGNQAQFAQGSGPQGQLEAAKLSLLDPPTSTR